MSDSGETSDSAEMGEAVKAYVLVDGENIDWAIGDALGHRPSPDDRPRWERVLEYAGRWSGKEPRGLFFINASSGEYSVPFAQALRALDFVPLLLSGEGKVVDEAIDLTLKAIAKREGDLLLLSHDGDFSASIAALLTADRRVGVLCFPERASSLLRDLATDGLELLDLETDAKVFLDHVRLPRLRVIPITDFDPEAYL